MNSQTSAHRSYYQSCWFLRDDEDYEGQQRAGEKSDSSRCWPGKPVPWRLLIRPPCCQSHQNTKCAGSHPNASISDAPWGRSRVQALLVAVGAPVSLQGEVCFTQAFPLSAGIAAAWPPRCWLAVQQFAHAYSPSCFPSSSFAVLDSLLLCSPSPFSRGSVRNGSYSSWRSINAAGRANRYGC